MAMGLVVVGYTLFATFVLRPQLRGRLGGRPFPSASGAMASAMVVISGLAASVVGQAVHSVTAGLLVYGAVLCALGTAFILRTASRPPR